MTSTEAPLVLETSTNQSTETYRDLKATNPDNSYVVKNEELSKNELESLSLSDQLRRKLITKEQIETRFADVLSRGVTNAQFIVDLPPDLEGEWAYNSPQEIARMQTLGFEIDREFAVKNAIHSDGTKKGILGDVIHMFRHKDIGNIHRRVVDARKKSLHDPKGKLPEEAISGATDLKTVNDSKTSIVSGQQIAASLSAKD